jgi:hypothetical protein
VLGLEVCNTSLPKRTANTAEFLKTVPYKDVLVIKCYIVLPGMMVHLYNPSTPEAEDLNYKFEASPDYIARLCLKNIYMELEAWLKRWSTCLANAKF